MRGASCTPSYSISLHEMPIKPGKETNWLDLEEEGNIECNLCERVRVDSLFSSRREGVVIDLEWILVDSAMR